MHKNARALTVFMGSWSPSGYGGQSWCDARLRLKEGRPEHELPLNGRPKFKKGTGATLDRGAASNSGSVALAASCKSEIKRLRAPGQLTASALRAKVLTWLLGIAAITALVTIAHVFLHFFLHVVELFLLLVGQDLANLAARSFMQAAHFGHLVLARHRFILHELRHLVMRILHNGFHFGLLIVCERK